MPDEQPERLLSLSIESCDCGDGYPCGHAPWVSEIHTPNHPVPWVVDRYTKRGQDIPDYAYSHAELADFPLWLVQRIALGGEMVALIEGVADGTATPERAREILAALEKDPVEHQLELDNQAWLAAHPEATA